jgi:ABC-type uncharacterized transport system permease subunit
VSRRQFLGIVAAGAGAGVAGAWYVRYCEPFWLR